MPVNHSLRRIASLSAFVLAITITSASHAGVIPWVYDAIFGPAPYRSYSNTPYAVSYSRPVVIRSYAPASSGYSYAPASGCSSCSTSYYAPMSYWVPSDTTPSYAMPSNGCGSCGPVAVAPSSGPCGTATYGSVTYASSSQGCLSGCSVTPATATSKPAPPAGKPAWTTKKPPEADQSPVPTTITPKVTPSTGTSTDDGLGTSGRSRGKPRVEPDANNAEEETGTRPASNEEEPIILKRNKVPAKITEPEFEPPVENNKPKEVKQPNDLELEFDGEKKSPGEARLRQPGVNLDAKIAWRTEPQRARVPFHAKVARASVTRLAPSADSDWTPVAAKVTGTQVAKK
ncbi:MAG: hypothetical protein ACKV2Q_17565 [Planctomycetaceae bacterium]